jgi:hypothetical protein
MPLLMSRSRVPVVAFAEPLAFAARFASQCSPPSRPVHGAIRIAPVHALCVRAPAFVISTFDRRRDDERARPTRRQLGRRRQAARPARRVSGLFDVALHDAGQSIGDVHRQLARLIGRRIDVDEHRRFVSGRDRIRRRVMMRAKLRERLQHFCRGIAHARIAIGGRGFLERFDRESSRVFRGARGDHLLEREHRDPADRRVVVVTDGARHAITARGSCDLPSASAAATAFVARVTRARSPAAD